MQQPQAAELTRMGAEKKPAPVPKPQAAVTQAVKSPTTPASRPAARKKLTPTEQGVRVAAKIRGQMALLGAWSQAKQALTAQSKGTFGGQSAAARQVGYDRLLSRTMKDPTSWRAQYLINRAAQDQTRANVLKARAGGNPEELAAAQKAYSEAQSSLRVGGRGWNPRLVAPSPAAAPRQQSASPPLRPSPRPRLEPVLQLASRAPSLSTPPRPSREERNEAIQRFIQQGGSGFWDELKHGLEALPRHVGGLLGV